MTYFLNIQSSDIPKNYDIQQKESNQIRYEYLTYFEVHCA